MPVAFALGGVGGDERRKKRNAAFEKSRDGVWARAWRTSGRVRDAPAASTKGSVSRLARACLTAHGSSLVPRAVASPPAHGVSRSPKKRQGPRVVRHELNVSGFYRGLEDRLDGNDAVLRKILNTA